MTWLQRYRVRHYLRNAIWVYPAVGIAAAMIAVRLLERLEVSLGWDGELNPDTTRALLGTLAGAMFTCIVFVCSSLLLVVQMASAQLTPRVIGTMFRDKVTKLTLSVFVFTFIFVLASLVRIGERVPQLTTEIAAYGCAASVAVFLYLIDHVGKMLRPTGVFAAVASQAHRVIEEAYPRRMSDPQTAEPSAEPLSAFVRVVTSPKGGVVLAFDLHGLIALATRHDGVVELVPQVGDFVAPGDPLFRVHGPREMPHRALRHSIALGAERTIEQDPAFAFRVIVDIALKSLSPAINDPTTAVLAIDRIHHLLRHVGSRRLDNETVRDPAGRVRLVYRTPDWDDFVALAITEIRHFGSASIQVARRLRAMLEDLIKTLPRQRSEALKLELELLKRSAERFFRDPEDRALADVSDSQGVGGSQELSRVR